MNDYNEFYINDVLDEFINYETSIICNSLLNDEFINSSFFESMYIIYGKDYLVDNSFNGLKGKLGIYLFFITDNISLTYENVLKFNEYGSGGKFKAYHQTNLHKGDCLYLGSSTSKSLYSRLQTHFNNKKEPSALHLSLTDRKILKDKVKIYVFPVANGKYKNINILLKAIEKELHDIYNPISGSPRV